MAAVVLSVGVSQYEACHTRCFISSCLRHSSHLCSRLFIEAINNLTFMPCSSWWFVCYHTLPSHFGEKAGRKSCDRSSHQNNVMCEEANMNENIGNWYISWDIQWTCATEFQNWAIYRKIWNIMWCIDFNVICIWAKYQKLINKNV